VILSAIPVLALAQNDLPTTPPYSQECQNGGDTISAESPLPHVATALRSRKTIRIFAIGASSLAGHRATKGGYTALIEQILERAVKGLDVVMINRGVSGELAANAATRIRNVVALNQPDLVLWQVGTNDALAYVPVSEILTTVADTVHWLREHRIDVILVGLQNANGMAANPHYVAVRDALRAMAAKENIIMVRRGEALRIISQVGNEPQALLPDEFERTEAGYTCLAQYVARAIAVGVFGKDLRRDESR
jgi:acyl-CoA thioesterase-1